MTTEHDIKQLAERLAKEFPDSYTVIDIELERHPGSDVNIKYQAYRSRLVNENHNPWSQSFHTLPELTAWLEAHWLKEEGK